MMFWDYEETGEVWITASENEKRADWAEEAVERFREVCKGENDVTAIYDLIGNLGHLYDRLRVTHDLSEDMMLQDENTGFGRLIELALMHYHAERGEGDDIEQAMRHDDEEEED